jgi:biopolymer transport protein TolQ
MGGHVSVLGYFLQAGLVVKLVMLILMLGSVFSWALIVQRYLFFKRHQAQSDQFARRFWECNDLSKLYSDLDTRPDEREGLAGIFHVGFKEYVRARKQNNSALPLAPIERVMQINQTKEALRLEQYLPFFSSLGAIAPYIGLFGTVCGIITSFQALSFAQQATIAMVAPGMSEALVATALGLFTAIPAVIAYNRYATRANDLLERYQLFQDELIALIDQQTSTAPRGQSNEFSA